MDSHYLSNFLDLFVPKTDLAKRKCIEDKVHSHIRDLENSSCAIAQFFDKQCQIIGSVSSELQTASLIGLAYSSRSRLILILKVPGYKFDLFVYSGSNTGSGCKSKFDLHNSILLLKDCIVGKLENYEAFCHVALENIEIIHQLKSQYAHGKLAENHQSFLFKVESTECILHGCKSKSFVDIKIRLFRPDSAFCFKTLKLEGKYLEIYALFELGKIYCLNIPKDHGYKDLLAGEEDNVLVLDNRIRIHPINVNALSASCCKLDILENIPTESISLTDSFQVLQSTSLRGLGRTSAFVLNVIYLDSSNEIVYASLYANKKHHVSHTRPAVGGLIMPYNFHEVKGNESPVYLSQINSGLYFSGFCKDLTLHVKYLDEIVNKRQDANYFGRILKYSIQLYAFSFIDVEIDVKKSDGSSCGSLNKLKFFATDHFRTVAVSIYGEKHIYLFCQYYDIAQLLDLIVQSGLSNRKSILMLFNQQFMSQKFIKSKRFLLKMEKDADIFQTNTHNILLNFVCEEL